MRTVPLVPIGTQVNALIVIGGPTLKKVGKQNETFYLCRCICKTEKHFTGRSLRRGNIQSCGCKPDSMEAQVKAGDQYYELLVLDDPIFVETNRGTERWCRARCSCYTIKMVCVARIISGTTKSCGCLKKVGYATTHALSHHTLYGVWSGMKSRCTNPNHDGWKDYGLRGITVCDMWSERFEEFYRWSMLNGYAEGLQIDRKNNDGPYSPDNCRFVTCKVNCGNRRTKGRNVNPLRYEYDGQRLSLNEWVDKTGIGLSTLKSRLQRGLSIEDALTKPLRRWASKP